ncbi:MAG: hypothetical protein IKU24_04545 [Clostridia bacterium]|nr:hypothetical protein [Clostridia bacterium]
MKKSLSIFLAICLFFLPSCKAKTVDSQEVFFGLHLEDGDVFLNDFLLFDQQKISFEKFRYYYLNYKDKYLKEDPSFFENQENENLLKEQVVSVLLDLFATNKLAEKHKVAITKNDQKALEEEVQKTIKSYENKDAFMKVLSDSHLTYDLYLDVLKSSFLNLKLFQTLFQDGGICAWNQEEFYHYYQENYLSTLEIFLPFEEGENEQNHPKTMEKAQEILGKIQSRNDFYLLSEKYDRGGNTKNYPEGKPLSKEEDFYQTVSAVSIGETTQPLLKKDGLSIIKRLEITPIHMDKNRESILFGYTDENGVRHSGAYDKNFISLYKKEAEKITVTYTDLWDEISTKTVF